MKKKEQLEELRGLSPQDLKAAGVTAAKELMTLRFQATAGQNEQPHMPKLLRKRIARIKTVQSESKSA